LGKVCERRIGKVIRKLGMWTLWILLPEGFEKQENQDGAKNIRIRGRKVTQLKKVEATTEEFPKKKKQPKDRKTQTIRRVII